MTGFFISFDPDARFQPYFKEWQTAEATHNSHEQPRSAVEALFLGSGMPENGITPMRRRVVWLEHGKVQMIGDTKEVCDAYEGI